jgi:hypothetical protein
MRLKTDFFSLRFAGFLCCLIATQHLGAEDRIYRCGNEYTNTPLNSKDCEVMQGQTITVIQGTRPSGAPKSQLSSAAPDRTKIASSSASPAPVSGASTGPTSPPEPLDAKFRDAQKRTILVAELKQVRERHAQLVQEYNAGEPEKMGGEARNHQKYLDRLAHLKAGMSRAERDMDSLQKELARLPSTQIAQP